MIENRQELQKIKLSSKGFRKLGFSTNDTYILAENSDDHYIEVWQIKSGNSILKIKLENAYPAKWNFDQNEKFIMVGYQNGSIAVWDIINGVQILKIQACTKPISYVGFCDQKAVTFAYREEKIISKKERESFINTTTLNIENIEHPSVVNNFAVDSNEGCTIFPSKGLLALTEVEPNQVATDHFKRKRKLLIIDINSRQKKYLFSEIQAAPQTIYFSNLGNYLVLLTSTYHSEYFLYIYDLNKGQEVIKKYSLKHSVSTSTISSDGSYFAWCFNSSNIIYLLKIYDRSLRIISTKHPPTNITFISDNYIAGIGYKHPKVFMELCNLKINLSFKNLKKTNLSRSDKIVFFAYDRNLVALAREYGLIELWNIKSNEKISEFKMSHYNSLDMIGLIFDSKSSAMFEIYLSMFSRQIIIFKFLDFHLSKKITYKFERAKLEGYLTDNFLTARTRISPSFKVIAFVINQWENKKNEKTLVIWNIETDTKLFEINFIKNISCFAFDPSGTLIAVAGDQDIIQVIKIPTGEVIHRIQRKDTIHELFFDNTGKRLVFNHLLLEIFDLNSQEFRIIDKSNLIDFSPQLYIQNEDGNLLLSKGVCGKFYFWRVVEHNHKFKLLLLWCSSPGLTLNGASVQGALGISDLNCTLFKQCGTKGEPTPLEAKRTSQSVINEHNAQVRIPGGKISFPLLNKGQREISEERWMVSIVRKRKEKVDEKHDEKRASINAGGDQHVRLILQGVMKGLDNEYYRVIKETHFFIDELKPHFKIEGKNGKKDFYYSGIALIQIREKSLWDLQTEAPTLIVRSYALLKREAEQLLAKCTKRSITRNKVWDSWSAMFGEAYSCLTWCEEKLKQIGLRLDAPIATELFAAYPENHLPDPDAKKDSCTIT